MNADESFFLLNPSHGRAVEPKSTINVYEVKNGSEKEGITEMAGFTADGLTVTPQIIHPYQSMSERVFHQRCIYPIANRNGTTVLFFWNTFLMYSILT